MLLFIYYIDNLLHRYIFFFLIEFNSECQGQRLRNGEHRYLEGIQVQETYPINKKNATIELEQFPQSGSIFHVCCENDTQCTKPSVQFPFAGGSTCPTDRLIYLLL